MTTKINIKTFLTTTLLTILLILIYYINGLVGILEFLLSLSLYAIIFYFFHILWSKIRRKNILDSGIFIKEFLYRISILIFVLISIVGGLSYLSNEIYPASMPEYTISNGNKIVKFQAMSHIGTQSFYKKIKENLTNYKKEGYVYFFEGVKPGSKENLEQFNQAIGIKFDKDLYKNFSKLYGVTNQDNSLFLGLVNNKDFNVDINLDQIMLLYNNKNEPTNENKKVKAPIDASKEIIKTLSQLNDKELKILVYINQAILNFIISSEKTQELLNNNLTNKKLFEVILGERNKVIANEIIKSKYKKIYTTYGLLHFKGVLKLLQENDPKWKIISTKYLYPIKE